MESIFVSELMLLMFLLWPSDFIPLNLVKQEEIGKLCLEASLTTSLLQFSLEREHLNSADWNGRMSGIVFTDIFSSIMEAFTEEAKDGC